MLAIPDILGAVCGAIPLEGGVIAGLFLTGAAGSPLHCGPMCGGFVLGQVADRLAAMPAGQMCERRRLTASALLPYHLGRLLTYAALGTAAGWGGAMVASIPYLNGMLLMAAAALILVMASRRIELFGMGRVVAQAGAFGDGPARIGPAPILFRVVPNGATVQPRERSVVGQADSRTPPAWWRRGLPLGLLLGFLPCGFLYGALAVAAASQDPLMGAIGMAAFAVGTMPMLLIIGFAGHAAGQRWRRMIIRIAPCVLVLNAALLMLLAVKALLG